MAEPRSHLQHAPIAEAVIDFRVLRQEQVSAEIFARLESLIGDRYPDKLQMHSFEAKFGFKQGQLMDPLSAQQAVGWSYRAESEVAQFRVDGFTFSKIAPYTTWGEVFGEALRLWSLYVNVAKPRQVSRIAVRYINRMQLDGSLGMGHYLEAPPRLPRPIPQTVQDFLSRVHVEDPSRRASAVIIQALEPRLDSATMSLLLDIDAFREVDVAASDPTLPALFEQLRQLKNDIFYASITEETVEIYK